MREVSEKHFGNFIRYNKGIAAYRSLHTPPRKDKTVITVIWGDTKLGKTTAIHEKWPEAFWLPNSKEKDKVWWDGYDGHETVVIDEFFGWIDITTMNRLMDFTPYKVEVKGALVEFLAKRILITSNQTPEEWYPGVKLKNLAVWNAFWRRIECVVHKTTYTEFCLEKHPTMRSPWWFKNLDRQFPIDIAEVVYEEPEEVEMLDFSQ